MTFLHGGSGSSVCWEVGWGVEGPRERQNVGSVLVVRGDARTPSEHCSGTLEQGTEPKNAHIGPCDELVSHPGVDLPLTSKSPPHDPKRDKVVKKTSCDSCTFEWQSE